MSHYNVNSHILCHMFIFWLNFRSTPSVFNGSQQRLISSVVLSRTGPEQRIVQGTLRSKPEGSCVFQQPLWHYQQVRTGKRGTEYQPNNIKRKRTHGWIKRISTPGGIEVILRRMLKGRKSLTH